MKNKTLAILMAGVIMTGLLSGCSGNETPTSTGQAISSEATYKWKMALNSTKGDNAYDTGAAFAEKVEELTKGKVKVELYGGASLGSTAEVLEGMSNRVADIMVESIGTLAPFTPLANIDAMPYMYTGYDHFMDVWSSDLGEEIKTEIGEASGFKLLGATYRGPRIVTSTKKMENVEDFKGFKLRAPNLAVYIKTWQWIGATPTPMAVNEIYTALQQKTVEGQENPMVDSMNYAFDEVCDYWIKTNHVYSSNVVIMSLDYFNSLPADIQAAVKEAAEFAGNQVSIAQADKDAAAEKELIAAGKQVIQVDNAAFADYFSDFSKTNFPELSDWTTRIVEMDKK